MTLIDLVESVAKKLRIPFKDADKAVRGVIDGIKYGIVHEDKVHINEFGQFRKVIRKNHGNWNNPRTGKKVTRQRRNNVKWTRSKLLDQVGDA